MRFDLNRILIVLLLSFSIPCLAQDENPISTVTKFAELVRLKDNDNAKKLCTPLIALTFFEEKKYNKYLRSEHFFEMTNLRIDEQRGKEIRIEFESGSKQKTREIYVKEIDGKFIISSKLELANIHKYYVSLDEANPQYVGWNRMPCRHIEIPQSLHIAQDDDNYLILGLELSMAQINKMIEDALPIQTKCVLVHGNVLPNDLSENYLGVAEVDSIEKLTNTPFNSSYVVTGGFKLNKGLTGKFKIKICQEEEE